MSSVFDSNPYYSPKKCGLETIGELEDPHASYSFSTVVAFRDIATGNVYACHDAGCSCPTPFENVNSLSDMTLVRTVDDLQGVIREAHTAYDHAEVAAFTRKVGDAL